MDYCIQKSYAAGSAHVRGVAEAKTFTFIRSPTYKKSQGPD